MGYLFALIKKELLIILKDPRSRLTILLPPLVQLLIFTYAATLDVKNTPIAILNLDKGEKAFELVQRFHGSRYFPKITYLEKVSDIKTYIDNQKGVMVLFIENNFSGNLDRRTPNKVQLILDGRRSNTAQILTGYATRIISQYSRDMEAKISFKQELIDLAPRYWFNPNLLYYWYNIASLVVLLAMVTCLVVTAQSVARERELGTFAQLVVSPLSPLAILIGKIIPGIAIGLAEGLFMLFTGIFLLQVPFTGSFFLYLLTLLVFVTSISGIGLFISALSFTQQQSLLGSFIFLIPSVLLSGFATPIENMPAWLQPVTYGIPLRYMLVISKGLFLKAMPAKIVFDNLWPIVAITLFNLVGATFCFRRRLQ
ncbi:MAG: ABC transporter permease [Parachlamydiales bacterium]|jgi:ABC-2 type transport system permease protein